MSDYAALRASGYENYMDNINARLLSEEMRLAGRVQSALLIDIPQPRTNGRFDWSGYNEPARENGGDLMEIFETPAGALVAIIGDVMGKGLGAALIGAGMKLEFLRSFYLHGGDDRCIIAELNRALYPKLKSFESYVTANLLRIDDQGRALAFVNAGHLPACLYSKRTGEIITLDSDGLPIGILPGENYEPSVIACEPGDYILMLTDGLTEIENAIGEMPGDQPFLDRFKALAQQGKTPSDIVESLLHMSKNWHGHSHLTGDDRTILTKTNICYLPSATDK